MVEESGPKKKDSPSRQDAAGDEYSLSGDFRGAVINIKASKAVKFTPGQDFKNVVNK